ncbi:MAG TPA: homocysteine S-methyltransferase family protein [Jiangellaceae bacterium]|nr:homocysteine S-methyltransferase family protein [Jiangellaceae bacterium]
MPSYRHIQQLLRDDRCVVLDGATGTELPRAYSAGTPLDEELWGTRALIEAPQEVLDVHRAYARLGCDVITTDTWGLASLLIDGGEQLWYPSREPVHWMDVARRGVALAREAISAEGRGDSAAVAFSMNAAIDALDGPDTVKLLCRVFDDDPPDLVLLETLTVIRPALATVVDELVAAGLPVWLSFRRCRHGLCGVYGQHWGGPEGDTFGRAARRFEDAGIAALLVNCIPPDHVDGMVSYLRDFTDLPLGVYPNLGYHTDQGWTSPTGIGGDEYADMAMRWRAEGAHIIGGCCGVGPHHIAAARDALAGTPRGAETRPPVEAAPQARKPAEVAPWTDPRERTLYPLPFPRLVCEPGVYVPTGSSLLAWQHLFAEGIGAHQRCLDVGSGTGILATQLALNGAAHVHAIDVDERAVQNTLDTAFRNGVADRVTAATADLFAWVPDERYEVIVASLSQTPVDPLHQLAGHRPLDYWGRNLIDHLIARLPDALAPEGVAYVVHLSVLSQTQTAAQLDMAGLRARVVAYSVLPFEPPFQENRAHVERVEGLSDAHHIQIGDDDFMVAYLLQIQHRGTDGRSDD